jgi:hypothetical protein
VRTKLGNVGIRMWIFCIETKVLYGDDEVRRVVCLHVFTSRHFKVIAVYVIDAGKTEASRSQIRPHFRDLFRLHAFFVSFQYKNRHLFAMCFSNQDVPSEDDYTDGDCLRVP